MDKPTTPDVKVTTDRYGITRQLIHNYAFSPDLPGATLIPSHKGDFGGQLGKREPIPMVIDPEYNGDSVIITPALLDANRAMLSSTDDPSDIYKAITTVAKPTQKEVTDPMAKKKQAALDIASGAPTKRRRRSAANKAAAKPAAPAAPKTAEPTAKVDTPTPPTAEDTRETPLTLSSLQGLLGEFSAGIKCDLAAMQEQIVDLGADVDSIMDESEAKAAPAVAPVPEATSTPSAPDTQDAPTPPPLGVEAPQVSVTLTFPESNFEVTSRYHYVIQSGSTLVLVYNKAYEAGDRVTPSVDLEHPYKIMAIQRDGTPAVRCKGMYMGQRFSHNGYDYILFAVESDDMGDQDD